MITLKLPNNIDAISTSSYVLITVRSFGKCPKFSAWYLLSLILSAEISNVVVIVLCRIIYHSHVSFNMCRLRCILKFVLN